MAKTRVGLTGPMAEYAGFEAKGLAAVTPDVTVTVPALVTTVIIGPLVSTVKA